MRGITGPFTVLCPVFGLGSSVSVEGYCSTDHLLSGRAAAAIFFFPSLKSPPHTHPHNAPSPTTAPPDGGSFTEEPVSYLIGVHLHSLNQRSHKWRESQSGQKKKKRKKKGCITQSCSSLIRLETYCGRCKIIPPTPPLSLSLHLVFPDERLD